MKYETVARRLQQCMANADMTASELSAKSGVSKYSISQYVNGKHMPSNLSASKIAKVFGVNPLWIMGYDVAQAISVEDEINRKVRLLSYRNKLRILERVDLLIEMQEGDDETDETS